MNDILFSAFLFSIVLLGIHSFFGLEIIKRGIIFTDLAIGQMAAVGGAVSILFLDGEYLDPISLALAEPSLPLLPDGQTRTRRLLDFSTRLDSQPYSSFFPSPTTEWRLFKS